MGENVWERANQKLVDEGRRVSWVAAFEDVRGIWERRYGKSGKRGKLERRYRKSGKERTRHTIGERGKRVRVIGACYRSLS